MGSSPLAPPFSVLSTSRLRCSAANYKSHSPSPFCLREAKEQGVKTLAIVNVVGSSIAREADSVFYTLAGPEIAVATTKGYSTQLIACYLLAMQFGLVRGALSEEHFRRLSEEIQTLPILLCAILPNHNK